MKTCFNCDTPKKLTEFTYRKGSDTYMRDCKECRNRKARLQRKKEPEGTQRVRVVDGRGHTIGTEACARCPSGVQLMCRDKCRAGRSILCEVMTEQERQLEYVKV